MENDEIFTENKSEVTLSYRDWKDHFTEIFKNHWKALLIYIFAGLTALIAIIESIDFFFPNLQFNKFLNP